MNKRISIVIAVVIVVIAVASYQINKAINQASQDASYKKVPQFIQKSIAEKEARSKEKKKEKSARKKTDPKELEKYGITITPRLSGPSTPKEWEEFITKNLEKSEIFESPEAKEVIRTMQVSEEEYETKIKNLDEHVEIIKERLQEDPFNKDHKEKLQNIYKLQAVGKALKRKVIVTDDKFISDVLSSSPDAPAAPAQEVSPDEQEQ